MSDTPCPSPSPPTTSEDMKVVDIDEQDEKEEALCELENYNMDISRLDLGNEHVEYEEFTIAEISYMLQCLRMAIGPYRSEVTFWNLNKQQTSVMLDLIHRILLVVTRENVPYTTAQCAVKNMFHILWKFQKQNKNRPNYKEVRFEDLSMFEKLVHKIYMILMKWAYPSYKSN